MNPRPLTISLLLLAAACARPAKPTTAPTPAPTSPVVTAPVDPEVMRFAGTVAVPGMELPFAVELTRGANGYTGKIQVPQQGTRDLPLSDVVVSRERISFAIAEVGAKWSARRDAKGAPADCSFEQGPAKLTCTLTAIDAAAYQALGVPVRPQEPKPPFDYDAIDVTYDNPAGAVKLAGTLTVPKGEGPFPAVLMVTGSGVQDRDESILGHKPFWVIADHLARHGVATLRVDDRGIGGSSGDPSKATTDDFVGDALAGVTFLATQPRVDAKHIGLIGHSEGGLIAPMAAARSKQIAFVVMLAGPGVPGAELMPRQVERLLQASGVPEAEIATAVAQQRAIMKIVASKHDEATARKEINAVLAGPSGELNEGLAPEIDRLLSPWFRNFARFDPRPTLAKVKVPVLALNGELDVQVDAEQNTVAIEKALRRNRKAEVKRMPGLNHLFQHATTGAVAEYAAIEETIAPEVLDTITTWIQQTTGSTPKRS
jgi:uncharacterized protein